MSMYYGYCSNPNCDFGYFYGENNSRNAITKKVELKPFCEKCGSKMVGKCPNCGAFRDGPQAVFCPHCGKRYKDAAQ